MIKIVIYIISDMNATLDEANVLILNEVTELNYTDTLNVTYQMLQDDRKESLGMAYGYFKKKEGVSFWVLPSLPMGLIIKEGNTDIKEYTEEEYKENVLPLWDIEEIEI